MKFLLFSLKSKDSDSSTPKKLQICNQRFDVEPIHVVIFELLLPLVRFNISEWESFTFQVEKWGDGYLSIWQKNLP